MSERLPEVENNWLIPVNIMIHEFLDAIERGEVNMANKQKPGKEKKKPPKARKDKPISDYKQSMKE